MSTENYCRLCAYKYSITGLRNVEELIKEKQLTSSVLQYLQVKLIDNDRLPLTFCLHCCQTLADLNEFRNNVINAQKKLENLIYYTNSQYENDIKPSKLTTFNQDILDNESSGGNDYVNSVHMFDLQLINDFKSENGQNYDEVASDRGSVSEDDKKPENLEITWPNSLEIDNEKLETCTNIDENILNIGLRILKNLRFKCYKCSNWMETETDLQDHFDTEHDAKMKYICPKCKSLFISLNDFKKHLYSHYLQKIDKKFRLTCEICSKKFESESILNAHKDQFHLDQNAFSCNECGKKFQSIEKLTEHEFIHKENTNHTYPKEKLFNCHQCGKSCISEYMLKRHLPTHVPKELRNNFQCDQCDRKFLNAINLANHQALHRSSNNNKHICDVCGKEFKLKVNMLEHKMTHTNARPYKCDKCPKTFKTQRTLQKHVVIHSDVKPFECMECGRKFRRKDDVTRHYAVHTDQLPFGCEFCPKRFKRKRCLEVHMRQHTGEYPYFCLECNHHFINSSNFMKHLKGKHRLNNVSLANNKHQYPFTE
ncbi:zinc finger protein OZF-like [Chrysoperla carnea]|uniref:zinc finger protein OZF-like n=1 Tax=Chrysoperla carnea TaxID=189513 RepID=UPI001D066F4C|nr:zinc finger protein OZF-like [Chrysoperla carnea]